MFNVGPAFFGSAPVSGAASFLAVAVGNGSSAPFLNMYSNTAGALTLLTDPSPQPPDTTVGVSFNSSGTLLAAGSDNALMYDNAAGMLTLNGSFVPPTGTPYPIAFLAACTFSPDGLAVVFGGNQYNSGGSDFNSTHPAMLISYSVSGITLTRLSDPTQPAATPYAVRFSPDSGLLAVAGALGTFSIYSNSGGTLTKLTDPPAYGLILDGSEDAANIVFSPDGNYLFISKQGTQPIVAFSNSSGTLTRLSDPTSTATNGYGLAISPDGVLVALGATGAPFLTLYSRASGALTQLADPVDQPPDAVGALAFNADGTFLFVGNNSSPFVTVYSIAAGVATKLTDPASQPNASVNGMAFI